MNITLKISARILKTEKEKNFNDINKLNTWIKKFDFDSHGGVNVKIIVDRERDMYCKEYNICSFEDFKLKFDTFVTAWVFGIY